jgi:hypothetical protein
MPRFGIEFNCQGTTCRGWLRLPEGTGPFPAVSDGDNRQHLDPWAQVRDYRSALSSPERHDEIDASGGHALILGAWPSSATYHHVLP